MQIYKTGMWKGCDKNDKRMLIKIERNFKNYMTSIF